MTYKLPIISLLIFICSINFVSFAQDEPRPLQRGEPRKISSIAIEEIIKEAKENNPEILAAEQKWLAEKSKIVPSRTPPDPQLGSSSGSSEMKTLSVSQAYPFPGKLSLKGNVAKETSDIYYEMYKAKELEIISKLKRAYYELFYIYKEIEIYKTNSELINHFSKVAEQRYAVGKTRLIEVLRTQVELSKYLNMLLTLEQDKETVQADINTLLNRPPDSFLGIPIEPEECPPLKLVIEEVEKIALARRPELIARQEDIERSRKSLTLSKMSYLPDFMGTYKRTEEGDMQNWDVMLNLTVPLYFWKQRGFVKEKSHDMNRAKSDYESVKNLTLYQVKALYVKVDTAQRLINLYKTNIIPQAEQALRVAEIAYRGEQISFLDLIDIQRSLLNFNLEYYNYIYMYQKYLAELERIAGGKIE